MKKKSGSKTKTTGAQRTVKRVLKTIKKDFDQAVDFVKQETTHMGLDSLKKLFIDELRDLYSAENQLTKALPKMAKAATNAELKAGFETHLTETEEQIVRLETIFEELGESPKGKTCAAMKGLIEEGNEMIKEWGNAAVKDAGLIACAQRVEHYEMAGYGCVRSYAEVLGEARATELLQATLDEESNTNEKLSDLAMTVINLEAAEAGDESETESNKVPPKGRKRSSTNAGAGSAAS